MKYGKPCLPFDQQADLLLRRDLQADRNVLIERLRTVSYYRLSGYFYPFRTPGRDEFLPGTTLDAVWDRYVFDRQLRVVVMDAVERVEVAVRARLVTAFSLKYGAFGHLRHANLPNIDRKRHRDLLRQIRAEARRSREPFVRHFHRKYTSERDLPLWMAAELMSFNSLLTLFNGVETPMKQALAADYGVADAVLSSWLLSLNTVRNVCAHHGRLWDRDLGTPIMIPRGHKHPEWHTPVDVGADPRRLFAVLTVLRYMLRLVAPQSRWHDRLRYLWTVKHPTIPLGTMGFPANWTDCPIWAEPPAGGPP